MQTSRENISDEVKSNVKACDKVRKANVREQFGDEDNVKATKKRMQTLHENDKQRKDNIFSSVPDCSMVDTSIFDTEAFKTIESEFKDAIKEGRFSYVIFVGNLNSEVM